MKHKTQADSNYRPHSCRPARDISIAAAFLTLGNGAESSAMVLKDMLALTHEHRGSGHTQGLGRSLLKMGSVGKSHYLLPLLLCCSPGICCLFRPETGHGDTFALTRCRLISGAGRKW